MNGVPHCDTEREMSLDEWVERLPETHRARKELVELRAEVKHYKEATLDFDKENDRLEAELVAAYQEKKNHAYSTQDAFDKVNNRMRRYGKALVKIKSIVSNTCNPNMVDIAVIVKDALEPCDKVKVDNEYINKVDMVLDKVDILLKEFTELQNVYLELQTENRKLKADIRKEQEKGDNLAANLSTVKAELVECKEHLELSLKGGVKEMEERWRVERKNDDLLKKYDEVATSNLILAIQLADIGEECTQLRELCKEIDSIDKTEDFINQKRREVMKFKENVDPVFTSEDLYDLFDGGYIDPKYLLEEPDASIVVDAIEVIKQFLEEAAELGHVVIT